MNSRFSSPPGLEPDPGRAAGRAAGRLRASLLAARPQLRVMAVAAGLSGPAGADGVVTRARELAAPVGILVNNAGVGDQGLFGQAEWGRTRPVLHTNVLAWRS